MSEPQLELSAKRAKAAPLSEAQLADMLAAKYAAPAYALFRGVRNATGFSRVTRTADAMAMSLWPSRGLELHGFEIKSSRGDWKREMENPEKAEAISAYCDRWWVVVADRGMVKPGDLPPTWGLLAPKGDSLVVAVEAPKLEPKAMDRAFIAALLRRCHEEWSVDAVRAELKQAAYREAYESASEAAKKHAGVEVERLQGQLKELRAKVNAFEAAAGLDIGTRSYSWNAPEKIGAAVRAVLGASHIRNDLENSKRALSEGLATIEAGLAALPKVEG